MGLLDLTPEKETPITENYLLERGWYKMIRSFTTVWRLSKSVEYNMDSQPHFLANVCSEIYIKIPIWGQIQIEHFWSQDEYRKANWTFYEAWWRNDVNHYLNNIKKIVDDKSKYTDWAKRDDIKAELKMDLILILAEYGYPPVTNDEVFKEIFEQAENFKKYNA